MFSIAEQYCCISRTCLLLTYVPNDKVRIFWERHKIWKNLPLKIWRYSITSNFKKKIFSNFVTFSEYPNFTTVRWKFHPSTILSTDQNIMQHSKLCYHWLIYLYEDKINAYPRIITTICYLVWILRFFWVFLLVM